ncbi:MAG: hypothetical protein Q9183_007025 [Haloplaca sp. 2 TL-2023]
MNHLVGAVNSTDAKWEEDKTLQSVTLLQNMIEASGESNYWTPEVLSQALLGYWFAASHQPWIVDYIELIRREIREMSSPQDADSISRLPLLDSFIKESVRINPLDKSKIGEFYLASAASA